VLRFARQAGVLFLAFVVGTIGAGRIIHEARGEVIEIGVNNDHLLADDCNVFYASIKNIAVCYFTHDNKLICSHPNIYQIGLRYLCTGSEFLSLLRAKNGCCRSNPLIKFGINCASSEWQKIAARTYRAQASYRDFGIFGLRSASVLKHKANRRSATKMPWNIPNATASKWLSFVSDPKFDVIKINEGSLLVLHSGELATQGFPLKNANFDCNSGSNGNCDSSDSRPVPSPIPWLPPLAFFLFGAVPLCLSLCMFAALASEGPKPMWQLVLPLAIILGLFGVYIVFHSTSLILTGYWSGSSRPLHGLSENVIVAPVVIPELKFSNVEGEILEVDPVRETVWRLG